MNDLRIVPFSLLVTRETVGGLGKEGLRIVRVMGNESIIVAEIGFLVNSKDHVPTIQSMHERRLSCIRSSYKAY